MSDKNLNQLVEDVIADGKVDADEVQELRDSIMEDGVVDRDEADALFKVNDAVSGNDNAPEWQACFVEAISSHVLDDEASPGAIDDDEAAWLIESIEGDDQVDPVEMALLANLKAKATSIPESLATKMEEWEVE